MHAGGFTNLLVSWCLLIQARGCLSLLPFFTMQKYLTLHWKKIDALSCQSKSFSSCGFIGPEKCRWGNGQLRYLFLFLLFLNTPIFTPCTLVHHSKWSPQWTLTSAQDCKVLYRVSMSSLESAWSLNNIISFDVKSTENYKLTSDGARLQPNDFSPWTLSDVCQSNLV